MKKKEKQNEGKSWEKGRKLLCTCIIEQLVAHAIKFIIELWRKLNLEGFHCVKIYGFYVELFIIQEDN